MWGSEGEGTRGSAGGKALHRTRRGEKRESQACCAAAAALSAATLLLVEKPRLPLLPGVKAAATARLGGGGRWACMALGGTWTDFQRLIAEPLQVRLSPRHDSQVGPPKIDSYASRVAAIITWKSDHMHVRPRGSCLRFPPITLPSSSRAIQHLGRRYVHFRTLSSSLRSAIEALRECFRVALRTVPCSNSL